jgi:hypothetical protein
MNASFAQPVKSSHGSNRLGEFAVNCVVQRLFAAPTPKALNMSSPGSAREAGATLGSKHGVVNAEGVPQEADYRGKSVIYQGGALVELFQSSMVRMCNPGWRCFAAYPGLGMFNAFGVNSFAKITAWPLGMMSAATLSPIPTVL